VNKYLLKIGALNKEPLPYRDRVEVIIRNKGKILLTRNPDEPDTHLWRGFPGGGVDGQTHSSACENECLEEVGVKIKNVKALGVTHTEEGMSTNKNRHLQYRGSKTNWYMADYDGLDTSVLGMDGDAQKHIWRSHEDALLDVERSAGTMKDSKMKALKLSKY
jgi:ADP-ribose pyrophosphatase YjhB (NUDIX family)